MSNTSMNNQTNLDWLARNVHEWPAGAAFVRIHANGNEPVFVTESGADCGGHVFTRQQWLARRAELQNKPSWKDAPEWARWLGHDQDGVWYWHANEPHQKGVDVNGQRYWMSSGASEIACKGEFLGDWRDTLEPRPEPKTRAQAEVELVRAVAEAFQSFTSIEDNKEQVMAHHEEEKQQGNDWFERGELPPVGAWCEASCDGAEPEKCKVIAYHKQQVAVQWSQFNQGCLDVLEMPGWAFRPLRTEREKAIEEMTAIMKGATTGIVLFEGGAAKLYDAGYRKEPK